LPAPDPVTGLVTVQMSSSDEQGTTVGPGEVDVRLRLPGA
jgi:hypothetical protein